MYGSILLCRGNATECFYSTLNLKCLGRFDNRHNNLYQVRVKGQELLHMGHKAAESPAHVGNKVLPICEASVTSSTSTDDQCVSSEKKEKQKGGDKNNTISRMKELLRWAAASQAEKGGKYIAIGRKVLHFRNRSGGKAPSQDDNDSTNSPKISFSWETLSCSTTSSAYTALSLTTPSKNNRKGAARASTNSLGHEDLMTSDNCIEENKVVKGDEDHHSPRAGNWITTDSESMTEEGLKGDGLDRLRLATNSTMSL
ncbi:hypothetical protein Scep_010406 [Stephania cephalantha]|uniref:Uncharacterized protein n=1 Tax=Stephania cephalantha TaxID=152367 RepID=A0AAP0PH14_9MAGN